MREKRIKKIKGTLEKHNNGIKKIKRKVQERSKKRERILDAHDGGSGGGPGKKMAPVVAVEWREKSKGKIKEKLGLVGKKELRREGSNGGGAWVVRKVAGKIWSTI